MRESVRAIKRANMVVVNGPPENRLRRRFEELEVVPQQMTVEPSRIYSLRDSSQQVALTSLSGSQVHGVAGIGNPARFFSALEEQGIQVIRHVFGDHHPYQSSDFRFARAEDIIIMTEKDAVKCHGLEIAASQCWVLAIDATLAADFFNQVDQCLDSVRASDQRSAL